MEKSKPEKTKQAAVKPAEPRYPLKKNAWLVIKFAVVCFLLPAASACIALLAFGGLVRDLQVGKMGLTASLLFMLAGLLFGLGASVFFFFRAYKYGTFPGYFSAVNSKRFKREMLKLIEGANVKYTAVSKGKYDDAEKEIRRHLQLSARSMREYKKFYLSNDSTAKLEAVTYNEALKMGEALSAEKFSYADFLAAVKKTHFCINELFIGAKAKAYKGDGDYVFISYSHRNSKVVGNVIQRLQEAKINVWFDEGITEGDDWMDHLARKIDNCSHFVMFQTPAYTKSANCNVEIKRALKTNRTVIRVILEESKLADGVEMYLDAIQAIDCRAGVDEGKLNRLIEILKKDLKKETKEG